MKIQDEIKLMIDNVWALEPKIIWLLNQSY